VKKIARQLLDKLKGEKFILDWQMREVAKAGVRETIRQELDLLPEVYDRKLWDEKVERTCQFVFERYGTPRPVSPACAPEPTFFRDVLWPYDARDQSATAIEAGRFYHLCYPWSYPARSHANPKT
jgi:hypothetical protein